jgi:UDP-N-acetylglucosamine acyltransferase
MIGGMSGIDKNVLPFSLAIGNRAKLRGLNLVGIRRNNFEKEEIKHISNLHDNLNFMDELKPGNKIDDIFINYKKILNEKLGHIQK